MAMSPNCNTKCSASYVGQGGDTILLASGGRGFEVLEEVEMVEVKQGPYAGNLDVTWFGHSGVS